MICERPVCKPARACVYTVIPGIVHRSCAVAVERENISFQATIMIRKAFLMTLRPGCQEEYERRHRSVWPEMQEVLHRHGVHNYSIFLEPQSERLFAYAEIESEQLWQRIAETEACRRWWAYMKELMLTNADNSPLSITLSEVFHLD
jgi:L-rhamnose mutarotase